MAGEGRFERYRLNAETCLKLAQDFTDRESKRALLGMANAWLTLAEQHLKNSQTILLYETPSAGNDPLSPVNEPPPPPDEPPSPPPIDEPPKPPVNEPPAKEPSPMRLDAAKSDDRMQS
jgi:hypothetical protein